jgi:hypothetical protein
MKMYDTDWWLIALSDVMPYSVKSLGNLTSTLIS